MAKFLESYYIKENYTKPFGVKFEIYVTGGYFGELFDISYYNIILKYQHIEQEVKRFEFQKKELPKIQQMIRKYIDFIECEKFDSISKAEYDFIMSDEYDEIVRLLYGKYITLNNDFSACKIGRSSFTIEDVGTKYFGSHSVWNRTTGDLSLKWNDTKIRIPIARVENNSIIEIKETQSQVNIFKILLFHYKLNLIYSFLYKKDYPYFGPIGWESKIELGLFKILCYDTLKGRCAYYNIEIRRDDFF